MPKAYRHNGPPVRMSLGARRSLAPGASAEIDVESTPEWSAARKWLARGWLVEAAPAAPAESATSDTHDLESLTVADLREIAERDGVELPSRCRKSEIIARLTDGGS